MKPGVILMVGFGIVERLQRHHLRHNWPGKQLCLLELGYVSLCYSLLFVVSVENNRTVLAADVRPLTIEFCGVMHHREK